MSISHRSRPTPGSYRHAAALLGLLGASLLLSLFLLLLLAPAPKIGVSAAATDSSSGGDPATGAGSKITGPCIGIDLGTTYSVSAIYRNGAVEIIPNELGNRITPSVVAFTDSEKLVGDGAKNQLPQNPKNTIYAVKRLIGRSFSDDNVQRDSKVLSYKIEASNSKKKDAPVVSVNYKGEQRQYSPEAISAMILQKMKEIAETYLGEKVNHAVVTVPAYFTEPQRQATKDAGTIAGLNVVRVLNEPTAAAIAYGLNEKNDGKEKNVLVFDLGGGTFDVSVLNIEDRFFEVLSTNGDTHLGGEDFDNRLVQHFVSIIKKKRGVDISKDQAALARLRKACEAAKRLLSNKPQATVEVDSIAPGVDLAERIGRAKFEELNMDLFKGTLKPVQKALEDAHLKKGDIDEVVLVGGSTRIPKVQQLLKDFFNGKELSKGINPDESVAHGAAVQAAVIAGVRNDVTTVDIIPLSLGIETVGGVMTNLINRNANIPISKSQTFSTHQDDQTAVDIQVYQGERKMTKDNQLLGKFQLTGIAKKPRGQPQIEVTFSVDADNLLSVTARDKDGDKEETITISNTNDRLSPEEIERLVAQAEESAEEDKRIHDRVEARNQLEGATYSTRSKVKGTSPSSSSAGGDDDGEKNDLQSALSPDEMDELKEAVDEAIKFLDESADDSSVEKEQYDEAREQLMRVAQPLLGKAGGGTSSSSSEDSDPEDL